MKLNWPILSINFNRRDRHGGLADRDYCRNLLRRFHYFPAHPKSLTSQRLYSVLDNMKRYLRSGYLALSGVNKHHQP
jgi:hypothetical protein